MTDYEDERIEFDFFDEPETEEAPRPRRRARRERTGGPRPPQPPTGLVPLARLVGLIALAIAIVVAFVFWIGACQGKSKHDEYAGYASKVRTLAQSSNRLGVEFANKLISAGLKQSDLETSLQQYAQQEQQAYDEAQQVRAPGPLRSIHQRLVDALELRAKGLAGLGDALANASSTKSAAATTAETDALTAQAKLLTASDVVWEQLYRLPATQQLKSVGVTGVVVPKSVFISNPDLVSARAFTIVYNTLHGASTGGAPSGKHGDQIVSTRAIPQGVDLSTTSPTTVKVSSDLAFQVTIENSGDFQEVNVPVTLTIAAGSGSPIICHKRVLVIQPAQQKSVTCGNLQLPTSAFGSKVTITAFVGAVAGEINTANNKAVYPVFFTLG